MIRNRIFFRRTVPADIIESEPEIGNILYVWSKKAKRMNLSVKPGGLVRVALPLGLSHEHGKIFLNSKRAWIIKKQNELRSRVPLHKLNKGNTTDDPRVILPARLKELAELHGFSFNRVRVVKMRSRWGSCSPGNNISLNYYLAFLPDELRDYVILHELVHTRIKNHQDHFWNVLSGYLAGRDPKIYHRQLRQYNIQPVKE